ncbi:hypothetical protein B9Z44_09720 [Limnohabitans curvus]|uniref:Uncharacterized protein n=1 Tax=Limnohabitans curvus TaxID=323423 RepID=A0A315EPJ2_9BURK|nr:hypothetical protein B9Z44_09720 [Limnohabitans curvus]
MVQALNRFTDVEARLVNFNPRIYGNRAFDEDIDFTKQSELVHELVEKADIVHCHHWIELQNNPFGIDLTRKLVVRQFHSEPGFVSRHAGVPVEIILNDRCPQLVVAQFHERLYPNARPVPNLLNFDSIDIALGAPLLAKKNAKCSVSFAPTSEVPAGMDRWNTKGAPETLVLLGKLQSELDFNMDVFRDLPHAQSLIRKASADIVIDDMVTGSYHLSGLEAMALGKPTLGFLDSRMVATLCLLTGSASLPWINMHLTALPKALVHLLKNVELRCNLGQYSAAWMRQYWNTQNLVVHYVQAYQDILRGQTHLRQIPINALSDQVIPDLNWLSLTEGLYSVN